MKTHFANQIYLVFILFTVLIALDIQRISYAANLNVGKPRTVRMIYFLPNDRPFRSDIIQKMKNEIRTVQTFYAEQMQAHGYGKKTFRLETDAKDKPKVHRVDGKHPFSYYDNTLGNAVIEELEQAFDFNENIYFIVLGADALRQANGVPAGGVGGRHDKDSGALLVPNEFNRWTVGHELGHTFGLEHDFRDRTYIMSYGPGRNRLSACAAEFLAVHPYFNSKSSIEEGQAPTIELMSALTYPAGTTSVSVQLKVSDSDRIHQVILFTTSLSSSLVSVKACRKVGKKEAVVEFKYDGVIPSDTVSSLSNPVAHPIMVEAVDTNGNISEPSFFTLSEISSRHIATLDDHTGWVHSVAFSPDGKTLASGAGNAGKGNAIILWDIASKKNIVIIEEYARDVAFSSDGTILASARASTIKLWDVETWHNFANLDGHLSPVMSVAFSPDGKTLASVGWDQTVRLWDVATQTNIATFSGHTDVVHSVAFSPDGTILASGSHDKTVRLWDVATQTNIATHSHWAAVQPVVFSPDGTRLAFGSFDQVKLWDVASKEIIATLDCIGGVNSVLFSPDGRTLACGTTSGTVELWDIATSISIATLGHTSAVNSVLFSPDGRTLACGTSGGTVELWDVSEWIGGSPEAAIEINIPDSNLRAAIAAAVDKLPSAAIFRENMATLTELDAIDASINDLTGLESATNLRILHLGSNNFSDVSPLAGLTKLKELYLEQNHIRDVTPLAGLINLEVLLLAGNPIEDASPLASLTKLRNVDVDIPQSSALPLIYWITPEGSIVGGDETFFVDLGLQKATSLALDSTGRKVYWTEQTGKHAGRVKRANLDGSNQQTLATLQSVPTDIAMDTADSKIYWANSRGRLQCANLNGKQIKTIIGNLSSPDNIALDVSGGKLYWTEQSNRIRRANLNGKNIQDVTIGLKNLSSIAVAGNKLYWTEQSKVKCANLDGSGIQTLATFTLQSAPINIAVDTVDSKIYWGDSSQEIYSANLNGKNIQFVLGVSGVPRDIAVSMTPSTSLNTATPDDTQVAYPFGDINLDTKVNKADLLLLVAALGESASASPNSDVDDDGIVTISDLLLVVEALDDPVIASAPGNDETTTSLDRAMLEAQLNILRSQSDDSLKYKRAIAFIQILLEATPPDTTRLLANYPNPFNPETWIPYQLSEPADVTLTIYAVNGQIVRQLSLGHQLADAYQSRRRAAYWDGRNALGEPVASGVYFYTLTAGGFSATKKMVIRK